MPGPAPISVLGEAARLVPAGTTAAFEVVAAPGAPADALSVRVTAPSKRQVPARVLPGDGPSVRRVEFVPTEVGTHIVEVATPDGERLPSGPLIAKVYDAGLIQVADVSGGVVGQPVQFRGEWCFAGWGV